MARSFFCDLKVSIVGRWTFAVLPFIVVLFGRGDIAAVVVHCQGMRGFRQDLQRFQEFYDRVLVIFGKRLESGRDGLRLAGMGEYRFPHCGITAVVAVRMLIGYAP